MVFQDYALFPHLSVAQNVAYGLPGGKKRKARVEEVLALAHLEGLDERMPHELSGGQQQRVAVARALVTDPALILADEPTGNLDSQSTADVLGLLQDLSAAGRTIVLITHEQEVAEAAQRTVRIRDGLVEQLAGAA